MILLAVKQPVASPEEQKQSALHAPNPGRAARFQLLSRKDLFANFLASRHPHRGCRHACSRALSTSEQPMPHPSASLQALVTALKQDEAHKILDIREVDAFQARRLPRSHNVPHRELKARLFELPPKGKPFSLLVPETGLTWSIWFQEHGWPPQVVFEDSDELWAAAEASEMIEAGPPQQRTLLFAPCQLLSECIEMIETSLVGLEPLSCLDVGTVPPYPQSPSLPLQPSTVRLLLGYLPMGCHRQASVPSAQKSRASQFSLKQDAAW
jgi:hypothetical protein